MLSFLSIFFFMTAMHTKTAFVFARGEKKMKMQWNLMLLFALVIVFLGTLARENVEVLTVSGTLEKDGMLNWAGMGYSFALHRYLPVLFMVYAFWLWKSLKSKQPSQARAFGIDCPGCCQYQLRFTSRNAGAAYCIGRLHTYFDILLEDCQTH
jgi:hypothetical protein